MNAHRVASDLTDRVAESRRLLEQEIRARLREVAAASQRALEGARKSRAAGHEAVEAELARLGAERLTSGKAAEHASACASLGFFRRRAYLPVRALRAAERMDIDEVKRRVDEAVNRILRMPAGLAELGLAMFVVDRSDAHWVGRREALELFNRRLDQLDAASHCGDGAKSDLARFTMVKMVLSLEAAGRGEYRVRDARP